MDFYEKLDRFFEEKRYDEVEPFLKETIRFAEEKGDKGLAISACNELGGFFRVLSRYEEGSDLYEKAIVWLKELKAEESDAYATTLLNYATTLSLSGEFEQALGKYEEALKLFTGKGESISYPVASVYNNMSLAYEGKGEPEAALEYLYKALKILENLPQSEIEIAITYSNLANNYLKLGDISKGEDYALKSVEKFRKTCGDRDVHYSAALSTLGEVYFEKADFPKAGELFSEALRLLERDYGRDNDGYRKTEENIRLCREKQL